MTILIEEFERKASKYCYKKKGLKYDNFKIDKNVNDTIQIKYKLDDKTETIWDVMQ